MSNIKDSVAYILYHYSCKDDLSNARVTKTVYLADWHHAIHYGRQITNINWYFDNYGPFVWDIMNEVNANPNLFLIEETANFYGKSKTLLALNNKQYKANLTMEQIESLDHVIKVSQNLMWDDFIKLVYSTYPIMTSERYSNLNLVEKASEYKEKSL